MSTRVASISFATSSEISRRLPNDRIATVRFSNVIKLTAGQTVNIYVYHNSTGTQSSEDYTQYFSMFRL